MARLEKIFMIVWYSALLFVVGALFNAAVAFAALYLQELQLIVPLLTGYGIYKFLQGSKNGNHKIQSNP